MDRPTPLKRIVLDRIIGEGPLRFDAFMSMALYYPGFGYYTKDAAVIGKSGDFYTGPHLNPLFGALLGSQMEEMWRAMGTPDRFDIVEMGPGMGYLALDLLNYLRGRDIGDVLRYTLVELNPSMRRRQEDLLAEHRAVLSWSSSLHEVGQFCGCLIANELLDAFPVRIIHREAELMEVYVDALGGEVVERLGPCDQDIEAYLAEFCPDWRRIMSPGYRTEINLQMKQWVYDVNERLSEGFVLIIDYGYPASDYYSEERSAGTLLCYRRHMLLDNPYDSPGEQDITAHVNFSALKTWGERCGLTALGFTSQGSYLISLGVEAVIRNLYGDTPCSQDLAGIKGLLMPEGMGESHKVMILQRGARPAKLSGFSVRNWLRRL